MIDQRKRIFAVNLWLTDLALTTASFFLAYRFRLLFEVEGHTLMSFRIYLWILAIILPTWAILLPAFQVYSEPTLPPWRQILRLSKAIGFAGLVMAALQYFIGQDASTRLVAVFTLLIINIFLFLFHFFF